MRFPCYPVDASFFKEWPVRVLLSRGKLSAFQTSCGIS
jgi:hypothetical protein